LENRIVEAYVIVATKGRAREVYELLDWLSEQTLQPRSVVIVGVESADVAGVETHPYAIGGKLHVLRTQTAGLCIQRNAGLDYLLAPDRQAGQVDGFFVTFFDDDFRPARDWLQHCRDTFLARPDVAALTGRVLADGARGASLSSAEARGYIEGRIAPSKHWASGERERDTGSMYGCNMAFRASVVRYCRFEENLPLYGWQEDQDYTAQARALGRTVYVPACKGVHLGCKSGRVSGMRFGYSQIANPLYLWRKGTMPAGKGARFVLRHLLANSARSLRRNTLVDYPGRLKGNLLAIVDILRGSCHPGRVLELR
jgi:hypothetical protein